MTKPSYLICATPRSGSTMLCDLLADTGLAGKPASYYRRQSIPRWIDRLGLTSPSGPGDIVFERAYLAAVMTAGSGDTGIFGLRLMWESMPELLARLTLVFPQPSSDLGRLEAAFGETVFLHLTRRDKVAQSISRLKAEQSGLWHVSADGSERERTGLAQPADYDPDRIDAFLHESRADDAAWNTWFADQSIDPVRLSYEELATEPQAVLARALEALGRDSARAHAVEVKTRQMADEDSVDWAARFRVERGHRS